MRFNSPPNWPAPPSGWQPPQGWQPDPSWGPAPTGWHFWVDDEVGSAQLPIPEPGPRPDFNDVVRRRDGETQSLGPRTRREARHTVPTPARVPELTRTQPEALPSAPAHIPLIGARKVARGLSASLARSDAELATLRARCAAQDEQMERLGVLGVTELERRRAELEQEAIQRQEALEHELRVLRNEAEQNLVEQRAEAEDLAGRIEALRSQIVVTEEAVLLQEAGIYSYRHPLDDAVAYQGELARLKDQIKAMARQVGGAVSGSTNWVINGSAAQGRSMMKEYSKLMLRAYNAEADNLVRGLKPYKLVSATDRLEKVASTIERLGKTMDIRVTHAYHLLRIRELELTADYLEKVAEEKEREREERTRLREERKVQQEIDRERARLDKEHQHYTNALAALMANGDADAAEKLRARLADIDAAIEDVDYRAANVRAGYVYVISNIGSLGEGMVKVGMTRRLEPMDRVRELSDASVPFNFDVHAIFFSNDAVGIEAQMHARLAPKRVNQVNLRREFFYATPAEAKKHLLELAGDLLQYEELPEALEFRQSHQAQPA